MEKVQTEAIRIQFIHITLKMQDCIHTKLYPHKYITMTTYQLEKPWTETTTNNTRKTDRVGDFLAHE